MSNLLEARVHSYEAGDFGFRLDMHRRVPGRTQPTSSAVLSSIHASNSLVPRPYRSRRTVRRRTHSLMSEENVLNMDQS